MSEQKGVEVDVWVVGYGDKANQLRDKVIELLQAGGNAHNSVVTIVNADVKCAERPEEDMPGMQVYASDVAGANRVAKGIFDSTGEAVVVVPLGGTYFPD